MPIVPHAPKVQLITVQCVQMPLDLLWSFIISGERRRNAIQIAQGDSTKMPVSQMYVSLVTFLVLIAQSTPPIVLLRLVVLQITTTTQPPANVFPSVPKGSTKTVQLINARTVIVPVQLACHFLNLTVLNAKPTKTPQNTICSSEPFRVLMSALLDSTKMWLLICVYCAMIIVRLAILTRPTV